MKALQKASSDVIAESIMGVQPMKGPTGQVFTLGVATAIEIQKDYPTIWYAEKAMWENQTPENIQVLKDLCKLSQIYVKIPTKDISEGCLYSRSAFRVEQEWMDEFGTIDSQMLKGINK